jgi:hypothetical protein
MALSGPTLCLPCGRSSFLNILDIMRDVRRPYEVTGMLSAPMISLCGTNLLWVNKYCNLLLLFGQLKTVFLTNIFMYNFICIVLSNIC